LPSHSLASPLNLDNCLALTKGLAVLKLELDPVHWLVALRITALGWVKPSFLFPVDSLKVRIGVEGICLLERKSVQSHSIPDEALELVGSEQHRFPSFRTLHDLVVLAELQVLSV